jgi:hypothetical protein
MNDERMYKKEALALFPIFGTILAITFDVGYFIKLDFNLFSVFSVSDHVSFALQLVPFISVASLVVILNSFLEGYLKRGELIERARTFWMLFGLLVFSILAALLTYWFSKNYVLIFAAIVGVLALVTVLLLWFAPGYFIEKNNVLVLASGTVLIFAAFVLGFDRARAEQNSRSYRYLIQTTDSEMRGRVLRSGDRGLLILERESQGLVLLPWTEVRKVIERRPNVPTMTKGNGTTT